MLVIDYLRIALTQTIGQLLLHLILICSLADTGVDGLWAAPPLTKSSGWYSCKKQFALDTGASCHL